MAIESKHYCIIPINRTPECPEDCVAEGDAIPTFLRIMYSTTRDQLRDLTMRYDCPNGIAEKCGLIIKSLDHEK